MQQQAQPPFCGQHPRAFWERSLLYAKCQPHGAVPPPVMPLSSPGTLAEGRGLCLALARWCLKEKPSCEGTLSPSLPTWDLVGGGWRVGTGLGDWGFGFLLRAPDSPACCRCPVYTSPAHPHPSAPSRPPPAGLRLQGRPSSSRPTRQPARHLWAPLCLSPRGQRGCAQQMPECGLVQGWGASPSPSLHPRALSSQAAEGRPGGRRALPWRREGEGFP